MSELGREREHRQEQRRRRQRHGAGDRLPAPRRRTQGAADHDRRCGDLDQVRRCEEAVQAHTTHPERRRPEGIVDDPRRTEDERGCESTRLPIRQSAIPCPALAQPEGETREEVEREQRPRGRDRGEAGLFRPGQDRARGVHVGVGGDVSAEHEPCGQDDHDRVDGTRFFNKPTHDLHARARANHTPKPRERRECTDPFAIGISAPRLSRR